MADLSISVMLLVRSLTERIYTVESTTPRVIDDNNTVSNRMSNRILRRTVVFGLGIAVMTGMAAPAFAATAIQTPQPVAGAVAAATPVTPAAAKAAGKVAAAKVAQPSTAALMPHGTPGHQSSIKPNSTQLANAAAIVKASKEMKLPPRAAVIAVATSLQESKLRNYGNLGHRNDHDSLGLFQQRPSCGWGSPSQVTNPDHAAKAFMGRLVKVHNWNKLPLTVAAQKVQVSAFGSRYAQWEVQAANLVKADYAAASTAVK
jgi:hypothetical protein